MTTPPSCWSSRASSRGAGAWPSCVERARREADQRAEQRHVHRGEQQRADARARRGRSPMRCQAPRSRGGAPAARKLACSTTSATRLHVDARASSAGRCQPQTTTSSTSDIASGVTMRGQRVGGIEAAARRPRRRGTARRRRPRSCAPPYDRSSRAVLRRSAQPSGTSASARRSRLARLIGNRSGQMTGSGGEDHRDEAQPRQQPRRQREEAEAVDRGPLFVRRGIAGRLRLDARDIARRDDPQQRDDRRRSANASGKPVNAVPGLDDFAQSPRPTDSRTGNARPRSSAGRSASTA